MLPTTYDALKSILRADPSIPGPDRNNLLGLLRTGVPPIGGPVASEPRLLRRAEAAHRLACSTRTIDKLAASGVLKKRKFPGRVRASGFLESDVAALIAA